MFFKEVVSQYRGLRREMYVLFFGRMMTNMGSIIMPMMSLILANKMGKTALEISWIFMIFTLIQLPLTVIFGKLADMFNKRNIIIVCDLMTVICYFVASTRSLDIFTITLLFAGALFQKLEFPSYDALVADFSKLEDRDRAYSLSYLGANLGFTLAPAIGGLLFATNLNLAFALNSVAVLISTCMIFIFIKDVTKEHTEGSLYEVEDSKISTFRIFFNKKALIFYIFCCSLSTIIYRQYELLLPLNLERLYGEAGATLFGFVTSINGLVVILFTPIFTQLFRKVDGIKKMVISEILIGASYLAYMCFEGIVPIYYIGMAVFTFGEIFGTLGHQPYLMKRIPASHRGRVSSVKHIATTGVQVVAQLGIGAMVDSSTMKSVWFLLVAVTVVTMLLYVVLNKWDKKSFAFAYKYF